MQAQGYSPKRAYVFGLQAFFALLVCAATLPLAGLLAEGLLSGTLPGIAIRLLSAVVLLWLVLGIVFIFVIVVTRPPPLDFESADTGAPHGDPLRRQTTEHAEPHL